MLRKVAMVCVVVMLVTVLAGVAGCTSANPSNPSTASAPTAQSTTTPTQTTPTTAALPTAPPTNIQSYTGPFVGSKNSNVYHYPWCYEAKKILPKNLVTFATVADACAAGYRPCEVCNPPACNPTPTPAPSATPQDAYQVAISGPTVLQPGEGGFWTATVYKNGVAMSPSDLTGKVYWVIDGNYHQTNTMMGDPVNSAVMRSDANGESTTWAPFGPHTLNAEYIGVPSDPNTSITVTSLGMPTPTPFVPTATPFPTATPTSIPTLTPTIIR
jgi:hypothetical protein